MKPKLENFLEHLLSIPNEVLNRDQIINCTESKKLTSSKFSLLSKNLIKEIDCNEKIILGLPFEGIIITQTQFHIIVNGFKSTHFLSYPLSEINKLEVKSKTMWSRGYVKIGNKTISNIGTCKEKNSENLSKSVNDYFNQLSIYEQNCILKELEDIKNGKESILTKEDIFFHENRERERKKIESENEKALQEEKRIEEEKRIIKLKQIQRENIIRTDHEKMINNAISISAGVDVYFYNLSPLSEDDYFDNSNDYYTTNGSNITTNEVLVELTNKTNLIKRQITAPTNGIIEFLYESKDVIAFIIFNSMEIRLNTLYSNLIKTFVDEFTEEKKIYFEYIGKPIFKIREYLQPNNNTQLDLNFLNSQSIKKPLLSNKYFNTNTNNYGIEISDKTFSISIENVNGLDYFIIYFHEKDYRLKDGDSIVFLFEDKNKISLSIKGNPYKSKSEIKHFKIPLYEEYIELFSISKVDKIRVNFIDGNYNKDYNHGNGFEIKSDFQYAFKRMFIDYCSIVRNEVAKYSPISKKSTNLNYNENQCCSVYLMIDTTNGYYKIGISNAPIYREKTLQSEKPTIELVCHKNFPDRQIAKGIEGGLHKAFKSHHVRGEWFKFSDLEVNKIIQTLT